MIVIDASAFLEVLMPSTSGLAVEALLADTMAPNLLDADTPPLRQVCDARWSPRTGA